MSVLIIALDDSTATSAASDGPPGTAAPLTPSPPVADVPDADLPMTAAPMSWNGAPLVWNWSALAKKKPPQPDPRFLPYPDPPTKTTPDNPSGGGAGARPAPANPVWANPDPAVGQPPVALPPRPLGPPGRSLLAAFSLRRALAGLGYVNVETASPDSNLIARALGDRRMLPGTLATLRGALRTLALTPSLPENVRAGAVDRATQSATNAASAVGQATGYRAVVAIYVGPIAEGRAPFSVVLSDSTRESGEPILWNESATTEESARETGAVTGAGLLDKSLRVWPAPAPASAKALAEAHLVRAKAAGAAGNFGLAQDEVLRVTALDSSRADAYIFLGDLLAPTDVAGAAVAYRKATQINQKDGQAYAKIAIALINSPTPNFPRVLEAGRQAITNGADSADLRVALARAQFGRADLFRRADQLANNNPNNPNNNVDYINNAEDAEANAQVNLERALQLSPNNPQVLKLMARALITSGRVTEGVHTLDRIAPLFPKDIELQFQYGNALLMLANRKEDAFVAFSRVWKARGEGAANVDPVSVQLLLQGFDEHVFSLGKAARLLSDGIAGGSIARESAVLRLARLKADMKDTADALALMPSPGGDTDPASIARAFAASLMIQSLEAHQTFLDTGQDMYRIRANEACRQAVDQLNAARGGG